MRTLLFLGCFLAAGLLANAQNFNKEKLDSLFLRLEEKQKTMGAIAIRQNGKPLYTNAIGYSSLEEQKKATEHTRYRIGSITKVFTATLVFQLIDEGKLRLETPLAAYFPQVPNAKRITVANLLNHSSGLFNLTSSKDFDPYKATTTEKSLATIAGFEPVFEPGMQSEYSNTNYILLGYILEKVEGKTYGKILEKRITRKLGLKDTYYGGPINTKKNEALSYLYTDSWEKAGETDMSLPHGAGALVSTPQDLTVFIHALFSKQLLSEKSFAKLISQENEVGFGLMRIETNGIVLYGHDGGIDGFSSLLIYVPAHELAVAFTSNGNQYPKQQIVMSAIAASLGMPFELPTFEEIAVCAEELEQYVGVYTSEDAPSSLTIVHKEGKLWGGPSGQGGFAMKATAQHRFVLEETGITLEFIPKENSLRFSQGGKNMLFKKER